MAKINPGSFLLNDRQITIDIQDSLSSIAKKINRLSCSSSVKAKIIRDNIGYRLRLTTYRGSVVIKDPKGVLLDFYNEGSIGVSSNHLIQIIGGSLSYYSSFCRKREKNYQSREKIVRATHSLQKTARVSELINFTLANNNQPELHKTPSPKDYNKQKSSLDKISEKNNSEFLYHYSGNMVEKEYKPNTKSKYIDSSNKENRTKSINQNYRTYSNEEKNITNEFLSVKASQVLECYDQNIKSKPSAYVISRLTELQYKEKNYSPRESCKRILFSDNSSSPRSASSDLSNEKLLKQVEKLNSDGIHFCDIRDFEAAEAKFLQAYNMCSEDDTIKDTIYSNLCLATEGLQESRRQIKSLKKEGLELYEDKRYEEAVAKFRAAFKFCSDYESANELSTLINAAKDEAEKLLESKTEQKKLALIEKNIEIELLWEKFYQLFDKKEYKKAATLMKEAIEIYSEDAEVVKALQEVIEYTENKIQKLIEEADGFNEKGILLCKNNQYNEALEAFQDALESCHGLEEVDLKEALECNFNLVKELLEANNGFEVDQHFLNVNYF